MKKLLFVLLVFALAGCATANHKKNDVCKIKGQDCWQIVQMLDDTQEVPANDEVAKQDWWNIPGGTKYLNAGLKDLGLTITQHIMFRDGGSTIDIIEGDEVPVSIRRYIILGTPDYDGALVQFKDGPAFTYDKDGNLVK